MRSSLMGAAGAALVLALLPVASAEAAPTARAKPTVLSLSIKEVESKKIVASLRCNPPRGNHPAKQDACQQIESAGGDLNRLPGRQTFAACAKIYLPIVAKATGVANGKPVDYKRTFPNRCEMGVATGSVFELFKPE